MYYNSNQNSNDYYSSYKKEMSLGKEYEPKSSLPLLFKVGFGVLLLSALGIGSIYLINHFSTEQRESNVTVLLDQNKEIKLENNTTTIEKLTHVPQIILLEENLPKSVQIQESEYKIISQLKENATDTLSKNSHTQSKEHNAIKNEVIALEETLNMSSKEIENIIKIIMNKKKEEKKSSLEEALLNAEDKRSPTKTLEESNHYNKVVLASKKENSKNQLINLSNDLDTLLEDSDLKNKTSNYEKSLKAEALVRSNEMRIIIVKKGDTLSKIAKKAYGNIKSYDKIFKANPEIIKNPDQIFVGQKLRIPS